MALPHGKVEADLDSINRMGWSAERGGQEVFNHGVDDRRQTRMDTDEAEDRRLRMEDGRRFKPTFNMFWKNHHWIKSAGGVSDADPPHPILNPCWLLHCSSEEGAHE